MKKLNHINRKTVIIGMVILIIIVTLAAVYVLYQQSPDETTDTTAIFDFDSGFPELDNNQATPFNQTSNGITAYFSSTSDPEAFTVTSDHKTTLNLSMFAGKYLYDNDGIRDVLEIKFSANLFAVNVTFATAEPEEGTPSLPSDILMLAYQDTKLVGTANAYGDFSGDSYPEGTMALKTGLPFNWIRIAMSEESPANDFLLDNIRVTANIPPHT